MFDPNSCPATYFAKTNLDTGYNVMPYVVQNSVYKLIAVLYPCLVLVNRLYQSNVFIGYEIYVIKPKNSCKKGLNSREKGVKSKNPANVDIS